jgi:hypothetical protein
MLVMLSISLLLSRSFPLGSLRSLPPHQFRDISF